MAQGKTAERQRVIREVRRSPAARVKVAVSDTDGVLRGKYLHKEKFLSAVESGFGFCNVVFGWDANDAPYDNTVWTGWHTGFLDALARLDLATYRRVPWDDDVPFFLGEFVEQNGDPLPVCPRQLYKRILAHAGRLGFQVLAGLEYEWFNFRETPKTLADKGYIRPEPITPGMFGYSLIRASQNQPFFRALMEECAAVRIAEKAMRVLAGFVMAALLVSASLAEAQQPQRLPRVGLLTYGSPAPAPFPEGVVVAGLKELGWVDGKNMTLLIRYAEGRPERLPELARTLVGSNVDIIVTVGTDVVRTVKDIVGKTPFVAAVSEDPVEIGLVSSLGRPGGNMTGVTFISSELAGKRLELLKQSLPRTSRVAVLWDPTHVDLEVRELEPAAHALGIKLHSVEARAPEAIDAALLSIAAGGADALMVVPSRMFNRNAKRIADFALERRLPVVSMWASFADAGGLMTYGPDVPATIRQMAAHVDKILKGAKPGDLPIERPTRFELVVNLKTAKALGVTLPQSILVRADRVIE